jgi:hypothetical protein
MKSFAKILFAALLLIAAVAVLDAPAPAAVTKTLLWNANTDTDLAGYKLYQGSAATGPWTLVQSLGLVTTATVTLTADGDYFWTVTAVDATGNEGVKCPPVTFRLDTTAPAAVQGLRLAP